jgi:benzoyl-CoA reductase subunit BamC
VKTEKIEKNKKIIKTIKIDVDKCNGCRACEVICSALHAVPQYSSSNPARARVRVIREPLSDIYVPVFAGEYTAAECAGRDKYVIDGKEYEECAFCRASCPSRDIFKEPDSDLPLKCDMCESDPTIQEPMCVQWCLADALTYEECAFCRASCPSRDIFKEPDSDLPLKCDMCESDPTIQEPMCVQWCLADALTYEEREEEIDEEQAPEEVDEGLEALANRHGWDKVRDAVKRLSKVG